MRVRHSSITRYVIAYVILASLALLLLLMGPIGARLIAVLVIPATALVTVILIGDFMSRRNAVAADVLRGLVGPSLFTYLLIGGLTPLLTTAYRVYSLVIDYLMNFLAMAVIGALTNRYSLRWRDLGSVGALLRYLSYFFISLGLGYLFGAMYPPLFYPFVAVSIIYLVLAPLALMEGRGLSVKRFLGNSRSLALAAFGIGLLYTLLSIPKPPIWNTYILITFVIIASVAVAYVGYRLYIGGLEAVEGIEEELYERHKREIGVVPSPEYALLEEAIREFVTSGKKDKLIAYLTHELTIDGLDYEAIINRLDRLINYSSVTTRRRVSRRVLELEVRDRINLVNELLRELLSNKST